MKDQETYRKVWEKHVLKDGTARCEECDRKLKLKLHPNHKDLIINVEMFSHILTKAAFPEHRHNVDNFNLLCGYCHRRWEDGAEGRKSMKIYPGNQETIARLKGLSSNENVIRV